MHNTFYASGFLYHLPTQQILLQQTIIDDVTSFSLFSGKSNQGETAPAAFQRILREILKKTISLNSIHPIYDYFYKEVGKNNFLAYAEISDPDTYTNFEKNSQAKWFTPKKLQKLPLPEQIHHDIIVGQRVIRAAEESQVIITK